MITVIGLMELYSKEARYCSNRKEVKDHGADAGNLLGSELRDGDRMEVGKGGVVTAQQEVQGRVVIDDQVKAALDAYYEQYGVK